MNKDSVTILKEAILRDPNHFASGWDGVLLKARESAFYQKIMKEALLKDMAQALGAVHDRVIEAAKAAAIGRQMIWVVLTKEALVRFYKQKLAKAYVVGETEPLLAPEKMETQNISPTVELASKAVFSLSYLEDAPWSVIERETGEAGRALAQLETEKIFALYDGISAGDLAGGAIQTTGDGASFAWADVVKLFSAVKKENFNPTVLVINPAEAEGLLSDDKFIHQQYFADPATIRTGVIGDTRLGLKVIQSTLITAGTKLCIDIDWAAALVLRRDITTEPFEDPGNLRTGIIASERIGLGVLRTKAVAKGT